MTAEQLAVLDDLARMQEVDRRGMLRLINELPEQCETALGIGRNVMIEPLEAKPNVVYISAVGSAAIAAEMAETVLGDDLNVPMVVGRGERVPKYVGNESLVIVLDYSGNSETVLRAYREAKSRGSKLICLTTKGPLLEAASNDATPIVKIPPGQPARTAIGYLFVPLVAVLEQIGLVEGAIENLSHAIKLMKNVRETLRLENSSSRNIAKQVAVKLVGKLVVVQAAPGYRSPLGRRWKSQLGANSKSPAVMGVFPDMLEGEISAWELAKKHCCKDVAFVFLKDAQDKTELPGMMEASKAVLGEFDVVDVEIKGSTAMEKLLYGVYFGDYLSYYLSLLYRVDPTATEYAASVESILAGEASE